MYIYIVLVFLLYSSAQLTRCCSNDSLIGDGCAVQSNIIYPSCVFTWCSCSRAVFCLWPFQSNIPAICICFQSIQKPTPYVCKTWSGSKRCALGVWCVSLECVSCCVSQCEVRGGFPWWLIERSQWASRWSSVSGPMSCFFFHLFISIAEKRGCRAQWASSPTDRFWPMDQPFHSLLDQWCQFSPM